MIYLLLFIAECDSPSVLETKRYLHDIYKSLGIHEYIQQWTESSLPTLGRTFEVDESFGHQGSRRGQRRPRGSLWATLPAHLDALSHQCNGWWVDLGANGPGNNFDETNGGELQLLYFFLLDCSSVVFLVSFYNSLELLFFFSGYVFVETYVSKKLFVAGIMDYSKISKSPKDKGHVSQTHSVKPLIEGIHSSFSLIHHHFRVCFQSSQTPPYPGQYIVLIVHTYVNCKLINTSYYLHLSYLLWKRMKYHISSPWRSPNQVVRWIGRWVKNWSWWLLHGLTKHPIIRTKSEPSLQSMASGSTWELEIICRQV